MKFDIAGENDAFCFYFTKEKSYELIGQQFKLLPTAMIHVADSKHFIMYDQPQWFYNEIDAFLK